MCWSHSVRIALCRAICELLVVDSIFMAGWATAAGSAVVVGLQPVNRPPVRASAAISETAYVRFFTV